MKYRLVTEPFGSKLNYYIEKYREDLGVWVFVSGSLRDNIASAKNIFEGIKNGETPPEKTILDECEI